MMHWEFPKPEDDPKYKKDYDAVFGEGSFDRDKAAKKEQRQIPKFEDTAPKDPKEYTLNSRFFWDPDKSVGVVEKDGKFVGVACLVAKEVADPASYVKRFGLDFRRDIQWKGISGLLDHLARAPLFKAVLVTSSDVSFDLKPDIPRELEGRMRWLNRNFNYHKATLDALKDDIKLEKELGMFPVSQKTLDREKEENLNANRFLDEKRADESRIQERLRKHAQIKANLFTASLFFYVYTSEFNNSDQAFKEIARKRYAAKMEIVKSYFIKCTDVGDPEIVFTGFIPNPSRLRTYGNIALSENAAGFRSDKDVAIALRKMFTAALEVPKEEFQVEEQIHIPDEKVSQEGPRKAFLGHVLSSVVKDKVTKSRVYFPLDVLTRHCVLYGVTRSGKSLLALILIKEALANGIKVVVFDPHGSLVNRLGEKENLKVYRVHGDITGKLREIYEIASSWEETAELKLLVVLDETRLLRAKNLVNCVNELGKRGVGFVLITQYSTSLPPEVRNVGSYFILSSMTEVEQQRFREVTLHPSSNLISRLPRATSFVFSPYWSGEPFFIRHKSVESTKNVGGKSGKIPHVPI